MRGHLVSDIPWNLYLPIRRSLIVEDWIAGYGYQGGSAVDRIGAWRGAIAGTLAPAAAAANEPTSIRNGTPSNQPVLRFDGVANYLEVPAFDLSSSDAFDWWFMVKRNASATQDFVMFSGTAIYRMRNAPVGNVRMQQVGNVGTNIWQDSSALLDTLRIHHGQSDIGLPGAAENLAFYDSTLTPYTGHLTTNNNTDANFGVGTMTFGGAAGGGTLASCDIARVIVTQPGTAAQRTTIAQFLSNVYGVP